MDVGADKAQPLVYAVAPNRRDDAKLVKMSGIDHEVC